MVRMRERMRFAFNRIPCQLPRQGHQLNPKLAKLGPSGKRFQPSTGAPRRACHARGGIVVVGMGGIQLSNDLHGVAEFEAVALSPELAKAGLRPVQLALNNVGPTTV